MLDQCRVIGEVAQGILGYGSITPEVSQRSVLGHGRVAEEEPQRSVSGRITPELTQRSVLRHGRVAGEESQRSFFGRVTPEVSQGREFAKVTGEVDVHARVLMTHTPHVTLHSDRLQLRVSLYILLCQI